MGKIPDDVNVDHDWKDVVFTDNQLCVCVCVFLAFRFHPVELFWLFRFFCLRSCTVSFALVFGNWLGTNVDDVKVSFIPEVSTHLRHWVGLSLFLPFHLSPSPTPLIQLGRLGERCKPPSGSGHLPFEVKIKHFRVLMYCLCCKLSHRYRLKAKDSKFVLEDTSRTKAKDNSTVSGYWCIVSAAITAPL